MRLDQLLTERGLFPSREQARRAVMAGTVLVDGRKIDKAGTKVSDDAEIRLLGGAREPFVSRGGRKLAGALDHFEIDPSGRTCCDVGASTGGFTDCLLQRGAKKVYAIDVGYNQLDYKLRNDPRVVVMERVNARRLASDALPERCSLMTMDLSFISLTKVVPAMLPHLTDDGLLIPLIKPQFEAGRDQVGKGGIVRDETIRRETIERTVAELCNLGLVCRGTVESSIAGATGNQEALALFERSDAEEAP